MLVLSRKTDQSIMIGDDIEIVVSSIDGNTVRIGIKAPRDIKILRKETFEEVRSENLRAVQAAAQLGESEMRAVLPHLPGSTPSDYSKEVKPDNSSGSGER